MTEENHFVTMTFGAATMQAPRVIGSAMFASQTTIEQTPTGSHIIRGLRIFKVGTFADSMGIVRTWDANDLDLMVRHFAMLRDNGVMPNVPVRVDHTQSVRDVGGYFVNVYRDLLDGDFLSSDVEITEPTVFEKWQRGTFRSRSVEIGQYKTNGETPQTYFPVVMGLAFVDVPAVEGLFSHEVPPGNFTQTVQDNPKENQVNEAQFLAACTYAAWVQAAEYAQACADWESACNYAAALDAHSAQAAALGVTPGQHTAPVGNQLVSFNLNGQRVDMTVTEMGNQLGALLTYRQETVNAARTGYVDDLAKHGKIGQTQVDSLKGLVLTMDDTQYDAFKSSYDAQGTASIFGQFGATGGPASQGQGNAATQGDDEIAILEEIVANHKRSGRSDDEIQAMASFKKLTTLKAAKAQA